MEQPEVDPDESDESEIDWSKPVNEFMFDEFKLSTNILPIDIVDFAQYLRATQTVGNSNDLRNYTIASLLASVCGLMKENSENLVNLMSWFVDNCGLSVEKGATVDEKVVIWENNYGELTADKLCHQMKMLFHNNPTLLKTLAIKQLPDSVPVNLLEKIELDLLLILSKISKSYVKPLQNKITKHIVAMMTMFVHCICSWNTMNHESQFNCSTLFTLRLPVTISKYKAILNIHSTMIITRLNKFNTFYFELESIATSHGAKEMDNVKMTLDALDRIWIELEKKYPFIKTSKRTLEKHVNIQNEEERLEKIVSVLERKHDLTDDQEYLTYIHLIEFFFKRKSILSEIFNDLRSALNKIPHNEISQIDKKSNVWRVVLEKNVRKDEDSVPTIVNHLLKMLGASITIDANGKQVELFGQRDINDKNYSPVNILYDSPEEITENIKLKVSLALALKSEKHIKQDSWVLISNFLNDLPILGNMNSLRSGFISTLINDARDSFKTMIEHDGNAITQSFDITNAGLFYEHLLGMLLITQRNMFFPDVTQYFNYMKMLHDTHDERFVTNIWDKGVRVLFESLLSYAKRYCDDYIKVGGPTMTQDNRDMLIAKYKFSSYREILETFETEIVMIEQRKHISNVMPIQSDPISNIKSFTEIGAISCKLLNDFLEKMNIVPILTKD